MLVGANGALASEGLFEPPRGVWDEQTLREHVVRGLAAPERTFAPPTSRDLRLPPAEGRLWGEWTIRSQLVELIEVDDNLFLQARGDRSDVTAHTVARFSAERSGTERAAAFDATVGRLEHFRFHDEDATDFSLGGRLQLGGGPARLVASARWEQATESFVRLGEDGRALVDVGRRAERRTTDLRLGAGYRWTKSRLHLEASRREDRFDRRRNDPELVQKELRLRGEHELSPIVDLIGEATLRRRDRRGPGQDSDGERFDAGVIWRPSPKARVEASVGHADEETDGGAGGSGVLTTEVDVLWEASELTAVEVSAARDIYPATAEGLQVISTLDVEARWEPEGPWSFLAGIDVERAKFDGPRSAWTLAPRLAMTYQSSETVVVSVELEEFRRWERRPGRDITSHRLTLQITLGFWSRAG